MHIVIVGGGSSGWLTAAGLIKKFPQYKISLIESNNIPTIGVGESTTTFVRNFIKHFLEIDENEFMREVDAIYKMSVKFNDFVEIGKSYHYPFGNPFSDNKIGISSWDILKFFNEKISDEDFVKYTYPSFFLFSENKIDKNINGEFDNFDYNLNLGYHFDANKLGTYLRDKFCIPLGVKHIIGNVLDVEFNESFVSNIILEDGKKIFGDIFIDCTGFKSILLGQKMKSKFIDTSDKLINNKAWATPVSYSDIYEQMQPYTTATAIDNGWCWYTPISSRIGNGYAYSDNFVDSERALKEFKKYLFETKNYNLSYKEIENLPFFEIRMKTGFYEESMIKNVVAIGMSSGFLEPLEGTGLHFIIEQITSLYKIIENGIPNQFLIDSFNLKVKNMYEVWIDTLLLIYLLTKRNDSEYWKYIFNMKSVDLDFKNQNHYHGMSDYAYRIMSSSGHNFVNDLFNNAVRGSGIIKNINSFDIKMFSIYENIDVESLSKNFENIYNKNMEKWKRNSRESFHIYDFLIKENSIRV